MRKLYIVGGIVGLAVAAVLTFAACLPTAGDDSPPAELSTTATATMFPAVSRPIASPTASPPPSPPLYEPIAWDERIRVQRLPPPTEAAALAERVVHRNDFAFGAEPPGFEGVTGGDGCGAASPAAPLRAGDWIVEVDTAAPEVQLVLTPHAPEFDRTGIQGLVPWMLRWTQLDGDRDRTHVHEQFWGGPDRTFQTPLLLPDAGTWRGIATYGPNWGCFVLEVESAITIPWMVNTAESLGASYPIATTSAERIARFEEILTRVRGLGTPARQCVAADGFPWARSGEFQTRVDQIVARWSPTRRGSKVPWTPLNDQSLGELIVLGASIDALSSTYSYREPGPVQSLDTDMEPTGEFTFITSITPPQPGSWLLIGSAEPGNWGCFEVTVGN